MNTFLWVAQVLVALFFLMPGWMKAASPVDKLLERGMIQSSDAVAPVRVLGIVELLGSIGIILPWWLGILPALTPIAAVGFCIVMVGAVVVHYRKGEFKILPVLIVSFGLAALVAYFRFKELSY